MFTDGHDWGRAGAAVEHYLLELPITFEHGAGVTVVVSRDEVEFTTPDEVEVGQLLSGRLRFPDGAARVGRCCVTRRG